MVADLDLNQLVKKPEYAATIRSVAEKDAGAQRHIKLVSFYVLLGMTVSVLAICLGVYLGWLPAEAEKQAWAKDVLQTLFPAAAGYVVGRQGPGRGES
jgi:hypothetical protein